MNNQKNITVLGATGAQGGSLAYALLHDPTYEFTVRAITRNSGSDKAKALSSEGAEIVEADLDDKDSLIRAFNGTYGVFGVTNFWEHFSPEKETLQAQNIADAAKATNAKHVIWSTFKDTRDLVPLEDQRMPTLQGKYKVPHFDSKGEANHYFVESGIPCTLLLTSFYWDNFINFGMGPQADEKGNLQITFPMGDKKLPGIAADDIGKCAYGIFKFGNKYIDKTVGIAGEHLTGKEMAEIFTKVLDKKVNYQAVTPEVYRSFGFPGADDLGNMFQYKHDFNEEYCSDRNIEECKRINPALKTFELWLEENKDKIKIN